MNQIQRQPKSEKILIKEKIIKFNKRVNIFFLFKFSQALREYILKLSIIKKVLPELGPEFETQDVHKLFQ